MLSYAPKRIGFKHDDYVARMQLAYLDHNSHLNCPILKNKDGLEVYTRKWGKRSARWHMVPVPAPKKYEYIPGKYILCVLVTLIITLVITTVQI